MKLGQEGHQFEASLYYISKTLSHRKKKSLNEFLLYSLPQRLCTKPVNLVLVVSREKYKEKYPCLSKVIDCILLFLLQLWQNELWWEQLRERASGSQFYGAVHRDREGGHGRRSLRQLVTVTHTQKAELWRLVLDFFAFLDSVQALWMVSPCFS